MSEKEKLIIALTQTHSLTELLQGNEYQQFLYSKLIEIKIELKRQLKHHE
jgi:hypothetical protein